MTAKPNYFKIGVFILAASALIVAGIVVLGAGMLEEDLVYFETYFDESVSGLYVGAPVENQGVPLGRVEEITFASRKYDLPGDVNEYSNYERYVMVIGSIPSENIERSEIASRGGYLADAIAHGLRLSLASNILTGQAYLQLDYVDPNRFPPMEIGWEPRSLYIPSRPSVLNTLKNSVDRILLKLEELDVQKVLGHVDELLVSTKTAVGDADVAGLSAEAKGLLADARSKVNAFDAEKIAGQIEGLVRDVNQAVEDVNVAALSEEIKSLFAEIRATNERIRGLLAGPEPDSSEKMANLAAVMGQLSSTLQRIDRLILTQTPRIEDTLENLRKASDDMKDLTEDLKKSPSSILLSSPPPKSEVLKNDK